MSDTPRAAVVLRPGDPGYDAELAGFQTGFPVRPELVVGAADAGETAAAVAHAAARGLPVAVQATGHGLAGAIEGGVLITTRRMDGVRIDPVARTARIGAGVSWARVVAAAAPYGLAPLNGSSPGVGAVSYLLGGGLGLLAREYGYAADHVRAFGLVTADGRSRRVTAADEPELFWALRGGGPGLGVVTEVETGLVPVARLYGGSLLFDCSGDGAGARADEVVAAYLEWTRGLPDTLTSGVSVLVFPDLPMVPEFLRGRYTVSVRVAYTGTAAEGERLVAPLRALGPVLADSLREMPYTDSAAIHSDPEQPHAYYGDSAMIRTPDAGTVRELLAATGPAAPVMCVVQLNHLGGALAKEPDVPGAVPHREAEFLVRLLSPLAGTDRAALRALYGPVLGALAPLTVGRSRNFSFGDGARAEGLHGAGTADRLAGLRSVYDPANLFGRGLGV
ncbi:FAD-binding oxidoreductase [Streptomyces sp. NPDC127033]|uniref:FAD-binding oxidoreductase n=1 Tax=Streptomyces sp. NPDC127033 TaxID=3347110 RepID=UPI003666DF13